MNDLKITKKNKSKIALIVMASILVITCFLVWGALWKSQDFREWICTATKGKNCYGVKIIHHFPDSGDRKRKENYD